MKAEAAPHEPASTAERCHWATGVNLRYHDEEWGVPIHDDRVWFEFLTLEGAQAGLSWETILKKRERYRKVFAGFDPAKVARFDRKKIRTLLGDSGIIRNRLKVESTVSNARAFLLVQKEFRSFDAYIWKLAGGVPLQNRWKTHRSVPAKTELATKISKELSRRGFRFVGPTICYAMMQATGVVNDHLTTCFRYAELGGKR
ncbi:MAG: DNA-3-methyladenine glycosylase I [Candidatus Acidiferrum sp.]